MADIRAKFNDRTDPSFQKENQCVAYVRVCPKCGNKFPIGSTSCKICGEARPRCSNTAMEGEHVCRAHAVGRPYSIYSKLAAQLSDSVLEEIVAADDRDLSQEFALAKVALSHALDQTPQVSSKELLGMIKDFFTIAEKKKNIESGQTLNISWGDEMVNSLRLKIRKLIKTFEEILKEYVKDEDLCNQIMLELRERTKLIGNSVTVPSKPSDYKEE